VPLDAATLDAAFRDWLRDTMPAGTYRAWVVETAADGIVAGGGTWPALVVSLVVALVFGLAVWRLRLTAPALPSPASGRGNLLGRLPGVSLPSVPDWSRFLLWGAFGIAVFNVLTRS